MKTDRGFIYVLTNPLFPNYIKIGRTKCIYSRLKKLTTSVPRKYKVEFLYETDNVTKIESRLHTIYRTDLLLNNHLASNEWYPVGENDFFDSVESFIKDIKDQINKLK